ncbi:RNA-directed DNA polymerase, eukaryota, reverse transcriptase zinc-binding domain protein [Tanacetum coccineum]
MSVCEKIDKLFKNFLWARGDNSKSMVSVNWKDVCKPKSQGGLGLKSVRSWNVALMAKHLWNVASDKDSIWVRWVKIHRLKGEGRFYEVLDVLVPNIVHDLDDKVVWIDKKGREKRFSVAEAWKVVKVEFPKVIWHKHVWYSQCIPRHGFIAWIAIKGRLKTKDRLSKWFFVQDLTCLLYGVDNESHNHLFFSCAYSKRLWERLKPMANMDNVSNVWPSVISSISNILVNKIWSVIQRLVFGAAIYFLWQERNFRIFQKKERCVDTLFDHIVNIIRYKLKGLSLKQTDDVINASRVWNLPINENVYYSNIVKELFDNYDL